MSTELAIAGGLLSMIAAITFVVLWALQYRKLILAQWEAESVPSYKKELGKAEKTIEALEKRVKELEHAEIDNTADSDLHTKLSRGVRAVEDSDNSETRFMSPSIDDSGDSGDQG